MNEFSATRLWLMRAAFVLMAMSIVFFQLLPLATTPRTWAGPDLLLGFALAWSLRRPDYVPSLVLALTFLLADLLLQRPPGLWAMLALIGCENFKSRGRALRDANFVAEWISAAIILTCVTLAYRVVLAVMLVDLPSLRLSLSELGLTLLCYPAIVAVTHFLMGVQKAAPGDWDAAGQRV